MCKYTYIYIYLYMYIYVKFPSSSLVSASPVVFILFSICYIVGFSLKIFDNI